MKVLLNLSHIDVNFDEVIITKLKSNYEKYWEKELHVNKDSNKYDKPERIFYRKFKCKFYAEKYLLNIDNTTMRRAMTQFSVGSHQLNIEVLRGKIKDPNLRTCICQDTQPEDEFHFLMTCSKFES